MRKKMASLGMAGMFFWGLLAGFIPAPAMVQAATGNTYYVATNGSDANDGSEASPWRSLQKAAESVGPGDTVLIRGGTYYETLAPRSGAEGSPITYRAYPGEGVTLSGADEVVGFTHHEGNIYVADLRLDLGDKNQLFVDGVMGFNARWPNAAPNEFYSGFATVESGSNTTIVDESLAAFPDGFFNGATLWVNAGDEWTSQTSTVRSHSGSTITFDGLGLNDRHNTPAKGNSYYLSNVYGALDTENEWYYDAAAEKLYLYGNPAGKTVQVRRRDTGIRLDGVSHVNIEGIHLLAANIYGSDVNNVRLDGITAYYAAHTAKITNPYGTDVASVTLIGSNNVIAGSEIAFSSGTGVLLRGDNNLLFNSMVHDTDYIGSYGVAVNLNGSGNVISNNTIYNSGRDLIIFQGGDGCVIQYNNVYNCGLICSDLGMFYTVATDGGGTEIHHNWFHDNLSSGSSSGIYLDNGTSNYLIHHNVVWNAGTPLQLNLPSEYISAYNNTFIGNVNQDFAWVFGSDAFGDRIVNNIITDRMSLKSESLARTNLVGLDPLFTDPAAHNYTLQAGSPAIDTAEPVPGITDGYLGARPDLGAYEYGAEYWTAGCNLEAPPPAPAMPLAVTRVQYANLVYNAGFEVGSLDGWDTSGPVVRAYPVGDPIQTDTGYTRTGYGSAKLTGGGEQGGAEEPLYLDFTDGNIADWGHDDPYQAAYSIEDDALLLATPTNAAEAVVVYNGGTWRSMAYEAELCIENDSLATQELGLVARYQSAQEYLYFAYQGYANTWQIRKKAGWDWQGEGGYLATVPSTVDIQPGVPFTVRVELEEEALRLYVNGELQVSAEDSMFSAGKIGFSMFEGNAGGLLRVNSVGITPLEEGGPGTDPEPEPEPEPGPEPEPELLFADDFDSGSLDAWNAVQVDMRAEEGGLLLTGGIAESFATAGSTGWQDYSFEADLAILNEDISAMQLGLLARYSNPGDLLLFSYVQYSNSWQIRKRANWTWEDKDGSGNLATGVSTVAIQPGETYRLRAELDGESLRFYVDGELQVEAVEETVTSGCAGFYMWEGSDSGMLLVDNVEVRAIPQAAEPAVGPEENEAETSGQREGAAQGAEPAPQAGPSGAGMGSISQTVGGLAPNTEYILTAWAKVEYGESAVLGIVGGDEVDIPESEGGVWTRHQLTFTTGGETELTLYYSKTSEGAGAVYLDDVGLMEVEKPPENNAEPERVVLNPASATIASGDLLAVRASVYPMDARVQAIEWQSSDESVASVDQNGQVLGLAAGSASITATVQGYPAIKASCTVTVTEGTSYTAHSLAALLADSSAWLAEGEPVFENGSVQLGEQQVLASRDTFLDEFLHLEMQLDFGAGQWYAVGVRSTNQLNAAWSGNGLYHVVLKEDQFELQKWGNGGGGANIDVKPNNGLAVQGEPFDFKIGAFNEDGGVRIVVEIGGARVFNHLDTTMPFEEAGYLNFYNFNDGSTMLLAPPQDGGDGGDGGTEGPGDGSQPGGDGSRPGGDGSQPGSGGSRPGGDGSRPGGDGSRPGGDGSRPGGDGSQPGGDGSQPGSDGSQPSGDNKTGGGGGPIAETGDSLAGAAVGYALLAAAALLTPVGVWLYRRRAGKNR